MSAELERERATLAIAERDIGEGLARLTRQEDIVIQLRKTGQDGTEAERLVQVMRATLDEWRRHRRMVEQRIAHLERTEKP